MKSRISVKLGRGSGKAHYAFPTRKDMGYRTIRCNIQYGMDMVYWQFYNFQLEFPNLINYSNTTRI